MTNKRHLLFYIFQFYISRIKSQYTYLFYDSEHK